MNEYASKGAKVVFSHPDNGYPHHRETARKHLKVGATYTVDRTYVGSLHTDVYLQGVDGIAFNSVHFDDA